MRTPSKRGKPVARRLPPLPAGGPYPQHALRGTVEILGDVVEPALPESAWDALSKKPRKARR